MSISLSCPANSIQGILRRFLSFWSRRPFVFEEANCGLFVADWFVAIGRPDLRDALLHATADHGGFKVCENSIKLCEEVGRAIVEATDLRVVETFSEGDIVLIEQSGVPMFGVAVTERMVAFRAPEGVFITGAQNPVAIFRALA